ncbi:MAG: hypothetical protein OXC60_13915 [Litoreibacter sp.]|nr:hypothetical protein [Litoreibacter sp.]
MEALGLGQMVAVCAVLGALLCSVVAVVMKPLNLGLFENIGLGALCGGVSAYLLRLFPVELLALMVALKLCAVLVPMVVIGLWLNARAR